MNINFFSKLNQNARRTPRLQYNHEIANELGDVKAAVILNLIVFYYQKDCETRQFYNRTGIDDFFAYRTQEKIAQQTGFSVSTVKRKIALLLKKGYIIAKKFCGFKQNFYQLGAKLLEFLGINQPRNEEQKAPETPKANNAAAADETPKQANHFRQPEKQNLTQKVVSTFAKTFTPKCLSNTPPTIDLGDEKAVCDYIEKTLETTINNLKKTGKYNRQNIYEAGKLYLSGKQLDALKRLNL